jgi:ATP-binding cassette subfamily B protein
MNAIEHVQAMGLEARAREKYLVQAGAALEAGVDEVKVAVGLERTSQIVAGMALALVAGIGGLFVVAGDLSLGSLTVCMAYITQLMKPIEKINEIASSISRGIARAERVQSVFDAERALAIDAGGTAVNDIEEIVCRDLSYRYPGSGVETISGFNYRFAKGECTAIVGPSGSGKSTMLRLLLRLQTPCGGRLNADGVPYECIDPGSLRSQFAVVMQNAHLFAGTFREVLTELRPDVGDERVRQALFDVRLLDLVDSYPDGLDTRIDEAGDRISGGQKARLLLARALLAERPVLVLDEPFANIDQNSKRIILGRLEHAKRDRILIVVTHERELLQIADRVVEMGGANLTHATLSDERGKGTHA